MSMSNLERGLTIVADNPDEADFDGPRVPALVDSAADALGVRLPPTYDRFLRELGVGGFGGTEFYGVIDRDWKATVPDAIGLTLRERDTYRMPEPYVIVGDTDQGYRYVLDTSQTDADGEAPVLLWMPGVSPEDAGSPEKVADSFGSFFLQQVQEAVAR
jgi:hypothetical protein